VWQVLGLINVYSRSGLNIKKCTFNFLLAKKLLSASWFLMFAAAFYYIYLRADQVMIGVFLGGREVGLYSSAVKLVEIWSFIPGIICTSLFPAILNAKKTDLFLYKKRMKALYLLIGVIAFLIAAFSTILAPWIINLLFGPSYLGAVAIFRIYVWSGIGLSFGWVISQYFLSENRIRDIFVYNLLSMLANITLNLILIPKFGLIGAAWATLLSYSMGPIIFGIFVWLGIFRSVKVLKNKELI
jgi:O-antigen/teichoic acid export membrane protein